MSLDETVEEDDLNDLLAVFGCSLSVVSTGKCSGIVLLFFC